MHDNENAASATRRPPAGLRHYIPLFFLAPSMLLMVHAWNDTGPPAPRVFVLLELGGFEFPRDVQLQVRWREDAYVLVEGARASFPVPDPGAISLALFVSRPGEPTRVAVGELHTYELKGVERPARLTLSVPAAACRLALRELREGD